VSNKAECPNCGGYTSNVPKGLCGCGWVHDVFISPAPKWITVELEFERSEALELARIARDNRMYEVSQRIDEALEHREIPSFKWGLSDEEELNMVEYIRRRQEELYGKEADYV